MRRFSAETASRNFIRAMLAVFTMIVLLLAQSVFWTNAVSPPVRVILIAVALLSYFRPHNGLLVLAALTPLGQVGSRLLNSQMRGAEALVLAFLAGTLVRGWTLHRFRGFPWNWLHIAALVFGLIVAASAVEQIWLLQIQRDLPGAFLQDLVSYASRNYIRSFGGYTMVFHAMLLLEGLALLVYAAHYCRKRPELAWRLARMLVIGGVGAAAINFWFFASELIKTGEPAARLVEFFLRMRWSAHIGDVNAAGSFFAMILFISLGLSLRQRACRSGWIAAGLLTGLALWMTASRTAFVAAVLVGAISLGKTVLARSASVRSAAPTFGALSAMAVLGAQYFLSRPSSIPASQAVDIRWQFLGTTWRMLAAHPLFGVGIGQYARWSAHYSVPETLAFYLRENAHNNFAQVAGELGLVGLAAFLAVLAICLWPSSRSRAGNPVVTPVIVGLAAFIVSWLGGHPLLVPEVAYPFWIALAIVPGAASDIISRPHG